ncbi:MAG: hypothetical protein V7607_742 [Solirubrobacteraceae bacterium]
MSDVQALVHAPPLRWRVAHRVTAATPRAWAVALALVGLAVRAPLLPGPHYATPGGDSAGYLAAGEQLLRGHGFPGDYRMPGYPALLAVLGVLPGRVEDAAVVAQHLLGVGLVAAIVLAGWRWFGPPAGLLAGALAALTPIMAALEHAILADFLFGALCFAGAAAMVQALDGPDPPAPRWLLATGVVFAAAAYVKPAGQFLVAAPAIAVALSTRRVRPTVVATATVGAVVAVLVAPWAIRNRIEFGHASLTQQGGQTLFKRAFDRDRLPIDTTTADGRLVASLKARRDATAPTVELNEYVFQILTRSGRPADEVLELQRSVALAAIRRHPLEYAGGTFAGLQRTMHDVNAFTYADLGDKDVNSGFGAADDGSLKSVAAHAWFAVARTLSTAWWLVSLHALAALLALFAGARRSRVAAASLIAVWLAVALGTALTHGGLRRYSAELAPLLWMASAAGAVLVVGSIGRALRAPPPRARPTPTA